MHVVTGKTVRLAPRLANGERIGRFHLLREKARRRFYEFVAQGWHVLEFDAPFVGGIHVSAICAHLQAVADGRIPNLIINVPPGHTKSLLTSVMWPAWVWIDRPHTRWLFASNRLRLATRDSVKCRRLIESGWYQSNWGGGYQLTGDQNQKDRFENTRGGYRIIASVGSGTGERGDYVVVDDPHTVDEAESELERQNAVEWWNGSMSTRLNSLATGHKIVIQQRQHEADLSGDLLQKGGYELLCLPAEFEPERRSATSIGWVDPRREPGELLWPERVTAQHLAEMKATLGPYRYAGQYQQRPAPAEGGIFKRQAWRFWRPAAIELPDVPVTLPDGRHQTISAIALPARFDQVIQSWDLTFKDAAGSDFVAGGVWGALGADRFLLDQRRDRLNMLETLAAIRQLSLRWPEAGLKLVEDKANGPAVIATLQHEIAGLVAVNPQGGKMARAQAVSPQVEAGNVYLPHPAISPWVKEFIEECAAFPNGRHDDQVDQMTQALQRLLVSGPVYTIHESEFCVDEFAIPAYWPRAYALHVERNRAAALWGARDPQSGRVFLYAEKCWAQAEAAESAGAIATAGDWIPGVLDAASAGCSQADREALTQTYRQLGLNVVLAADAEEAGIQRTRQLLAANQLKVFRSLNGFLGEYRQYQWDQKGRAGQGTEDLLACCHALIVSGLSRMRVQPVKPVVSEPHHYPGPQGWMA